MFLRWVVLVVFGATCAQVAKVSITADDWHTAAVHSEGTVNGVGANKTITRQLF